ncbi:MAG: hypothetical protein SFU27_11260 [Thermonemataceae bacterium]|nr:hypothetical protein [Thermonemataceae bacterium]
MEALKNFISAITKSKPIVTAQPVIRNTLNYDEAKEIGVLFSHSNEDNPKALNYFVKLLKKDGKNIKILAYFEEKHSNPYDFRFDFFTAKEVDNRNQVKSLQVEEFIQKEFDYVYCINVTEFAVFDYIMQKSRAKCRIGKFYPKHTDGFEIMIDMGENTNAVDLILQMLHYTKSLIVHN